MAKGCKGKPTKPSVSADQIADVLWGLVDQRVYSARALARFDLRGYLAPDQIAAIRSIALRTIENNAVC